MVNQEIRQGLRQPQPSARYGDPPKTKPHHFSSRLGIDLDKLNHLADELEAEAFVARYDRETGAKQRDNRYRATFPNP